MTKETEINNIHIFRQETMLYGEEDNYPFRSNYHIEEEDKQRYLNGELDGQLADGLSEETFSKILTTPNGSVRMVKEYGGEGQGDEFWYVFGYTPKNTGEELYFRIDGYYSSFMGHDFEDAKFRQVHPHQVTTTEYR